MDNKTAAKRKQFNCCYVRANSRTAAIHQVREGGAE